MPRPRSEFVPGGALPTRGSPARGDGAGPGSGRGAQRSGWHGPQVSAIRVTPGPGRPPACGGLGRDPEGPGGRVLEAGREVGEEGGAEAGDVGREVGALVADVGGEGAGPGRVEEALADAEGGAVALGGGVAKEEGARAEEGGEGLDGAAGEEELVGGGVAREALGMAAAGDLSVVVLGLDTGQGNGGAREDRAGDKDTCALIHDVMMPRIKAGIMAK